MMKGKEKREKRKEVEAERQKHLAFPFEGFPEMM
jgi:hypothetical protein